MRAPRTPELEEFRKEAGGLKTHDMIFIFTYLFSISSCNLHFSPLSDFSEDFSGASRGPSSPISSFSA